MQEFPLFLSDYIFKDLDGFYFNGQNFDLNLHNDERANRQYLGTYFPRSFVESFNIYSELCQNPLIKESLLHQSELRILDIGAGTGGNMFGLVYYLHQAGYKGDVWFYTLDGNEIAIEYQIRLFKFLCRKLSMPFHLRHRNIVMDPKQIDLQINQVLNRVDFTKFNIIHSFKFISEFYFNDYDNACSLFNRFLKGLETYLDDNGILLLLDIVAGPRDHTRNFFMSQEMSKEINDYVNENNSLLSYILPISCGFWSDKCRNKSCYT